MSNNLLAGLVVGAIIILGAIALVVYGPSNQTSTTNTAAVGSLTGTVVSTTTVATSTGSQSTYPLILSTKSATNVASTTATLHGTVNPKGTAALYWFEYSSDPNLGAVLIRTTPPISLSASSTEVKVDTDLSGLARTTTYYFRVVASNLGGVVRSAPMTFTTK